MSMLEQLTKDTRDARGVYHIFKLQELREYLKTMPAEKLLEQIEKIDDTELLRTLIEAGLKTVLLDAVLSRYDRIIKRMRGE